MKNLNKKIMVVAFSAIVWVSWSLLLTENKNEIKTSLIESKVDWNFFRAENKYDNAENVVFNIFTKQELNLKSDYEYTISSNKENYYEVTFKVNDNVSKNDVIFTTANWIQILDKYFVDDQNNIYKID